MLAPITIILARILTKTSMGTIITTMQETMAEEITPILLIATMASKGKTRNGTLIPIMEAFLLITITKEITSILLITIMDSRGRTDNGTPIQIMEVFLLITTTTMSTMLISISITISKMHLTMMVHTTIAIRR